MEAKTLKMLTEKVHDKNKTELCNVLCLRDPSCEQ